MISIVTCIYDQDIDLFSACAKSVAAQTGKFEWIIVDDGSRKPKIDEYRDVLAQLSLWRSTEIIELDVNVGLSLARNVGIPRARGSWIVVLDSDDELGKATVETLSLLPSASRLACFDVDYVRSNGGVEKRRMRRWSELYRQFGRTVADPFLWFDFYYHGMIARRDVFNSIGLYDGSFRVGEDQDVLFKACELIEVDQLQFIEEVGYIYMENPKGVCYRMGSCRSQLCKVDAGCDAQKGNTIRNVSIGGRQRHRGYLHRRIRVFG
ncbi:glycosyltransferase family 2 protein [Bradyrhizobium sp. 25ACV]